LVTAQEAPFKQCGCYGDVIACFIPAALGGTHAVTHLNIQVKDTLHEQLNSAAMVRRFGCHQQQIYV